jgi:Tol biopolymer transport system component
MLNRHVFLTRIVVLLGAVGVMPLAAQPPAARIELISRMPFSVGDAKSSFFQTGRNAFSADGRYAVWTSTADTLPGVVDLNGRYDIYLADLELGTQTVISHSEADPGRAEGADEVAPCISADGRFIAYTATSGTDAARIPQLHVYDRVAGTRQLVSHAAGSGTTSANDSSTPIGLSADGRYLAFESHATDLIAGVADDFLTPDIFLWDRLTDNLQLVTHHHADPADAVGFFVQEHFFTGELSTDGRYLAYIADAFNLVPGGAGTQIYLFDRATGANTLVSRRTNGQIASASELADMSPDGRYVVFTSSSPAVLMVPGASEANIESDVFLFDRTTSGVELISRGASLVTGNAGSGNGRLSDDGSKIYFHSRATDLVAGITDTAATDDLFLRNRQAGTTTLISHTAANPAAAAHVHFAAGWPSSDGSSVTFNSSSASLVAGATPGASGPFVFRYDLGVGASLLSSGLAQPSVAHAAQTVAMAPTGQRLLWWTRSVFPLTGAHDPQGEHSQDLVLHDRGEGASFALHRAPTSGWEPGILSIFRRARMTDDGRRVAYITAGINCASGQVVPGAAEYACLFDRRTSAQQLLSHRWDDPSAAVSANAMEFLEFSSDGRWLLMTSPANGLAPTDTNGSCDTFLYDTQNRTYELISHQAGAPTVAAGGFSCRSLPVTISLGGDHYRSSLSSDATRVLFESTATDLDATATDGNGEQDVFLKDRTVGTHRLLTRSAASPSQAANDFSVAEQISTDGRFALLNSYATNLIASFVDGNVSDEPDLFLYDLNLGTGQLVSRSAASALRSGNGGIWGGLTAMSANGSFVAFTSIATDHVAGSDGGTDSDVFLFHQASGTVTLVSHALGQPAVAADGNSYVMDISNDGRYTLFLSNATNLTAVPPSPDLPVGAHLLYLADRVDGSVRLVSHRDGQPTQPVHASWGKLTADGQRALVVSFDETVTGVPDYNGSDDLFVWDGDEHSVALLSRRLEEPARTGAQGSSPHIGVPQINAEGSFVLFEGWPSDFVAHDTNATPDLFLAILSDLFADGFESGTTGAWSATQP